MACVTAHHPGSDAAEVDKIGQSLIHAFIKSLWIPLVESALLVQLVHEPLGVGIHILAKLLRFTRLGRRDQSQGHEEADQNVVSQCKHQDLLFDLPGPNQRPDAKLLISRSRFMADCVE